MYNKGQEKTENDRIFVVRLGSIDVEETQRKIRRLVEMAFEESREIRGAIREIVPEYRERQAEE